MSPLMKGRVTRSHVVRSEWSKLWSLRSTRYAIGLSVFLPYAFAVVIGLAIKRGGEKTAKIQMDPVLVSLSGLNFAQLLLPILGILLMTSEYTTGTIRPTLAAVPKRLWVLRGKVIVLIAVTLPAFLLVAFTAFPVAQMFLSGTSMEAPLGSPGVKRALVGAAVSLTLLSILGLGLGAIMRSTPLAIGQFVVTLMVIPQVMTILPYKWMKSASEFLPLKATESLMSAKPGLGHASPKEAFFALTAWAAVSLVAAGVALTRRDA